MSKPLAERVDEVLPCDCKRDGDPDPSEHVSNDGFSCAFYLRPAVLALLEALREECAALASEVLHSHGWKPYEEAARQISLIGERLPTFADMLGTLKDGD